jgi:hypothetical protein
MRSVALHDASLVDPATLQHYSGFIFRCSIFELHIIRCVSSVHALSLRVLGHLNVSLGGRCAEKPPLFPLTTLVCVTVRNFLFAFLLLGSAPLARSLLVAQLCPRSIPSCFKVELLSLHVSFM